MTLVVCLLWRITELTYDPAQFITASVLQRRCDQRSRVVLPPCFSVSLHHCRPVYLCSQLVCLRSAQVLRYVVTPPATSLTYMLRHFELCVQMWLVSPVCGPKIYFLTMRGHGCLGRRSILVTGVLISVIVQF